MVVVCRAPNAGPRWDLCTYSVPPEIRPRPQPCQATATMATRSAETQYVRCRHPTLVPTKPLANGGMRRNPAALARGTKSLGRSLETPDHRAWRPVGLNLPTPTYKVGIGNRVFAFDDPFRAAVDSQGSGNAAVFVVEPRGLPPSILRHSDASQCRPSIASCGVGPIPPWESGRARTGRAVEHLVAMFSCAASGHFHGGNGWSWACHRAWNFYYWRANCADGVACFPT